MMIFKECKSSLKLDMDSEREQRCCHELSGQTKRLDIRLRGYELAGVGQPDRTVANSDSIETSVTNPTILHAYSS